METTKRRRLAAKTRDGTLPLPRIWQRVESSKRPSDGRDAPGVMPKGDKVSEWYKHPAALLKEYPLSSAATAHREALPLLEGDLTYRMMRPLMQKLASRPAHSFQYKGRWISLSVEALATFYEDAALHEVGAVRMKEWWVSQSLSICHTGAALTFWYSMDGSMRLPDAIEAGLMSTRIAEFQAH